MHRGCGSVSPPVLSAGRFASNQTTHQRNRDSDGCKVGGADSLLRRRVGRRGAGQLRGQKRRGGAGVALLHLRGRTRCLCQVRRLLSTLVSFVRYRLSTFRTPYSEVLLGHLLPSSGCCCCCCCCSSCFASLLHCLLSFVLMLSFSDLSAFCLSAYVYMLLCYVSHPFHPLPTFYTHARRPIPLGLT